MKKLNRLKQALTTSFTRKEKTHVTSESLSPASFLDNSTLGHECNQTKCIPMVSYFDYTAEKSQELTFKSFDILSVEVDPSARWWKATNWRTGLQGIVPDSFLTDQPNEEDLAFEAWQEISRSEAQRQLMMHGLKEGTYILRPSSGWSN